MRISLLVAVWTVAVATVVGFAIRYEQTAGNTASDCTAWPTETVLHRDADHPTLVVFCHPRCPCTAASIAELSRLTTNCRDDLTTHVLFIQPTGVDTKWGQTRIRALAEAIAGIHVVNDRAGHTATRFGATTSGEAFLFSQEGQCIFHGGLTISRGHEGISRGRAAIEQWVDHQTCDTPNTPVFGCALFAAPNPQAICRAK